MLRLPALQRPTPSWQHKDKFLLLPSRPELYPGLFPWKKDTKDARFPWIRGKIFGCRPYQDGACMVPWEKGARRKMKRAMPALEATGEMQLMLCLPFSFPPNIVSPSHTIYSIFCLTKSIYCAIIYLLLNFVQFRNEKHTLFKFVRSQKV